MILYGFIFSVCATLSMQKCLVDNRKPGYMWEYRLSKKLQEHYNPGDPPGYPETRNATVNNILFISKSMDFTDDEETFYMYTWLVMSWNDRRLKWKPDEHDGIRIINVLNVDIWTPKLVLVEGSMSYIKGFIFYPCTLRFDGAVKCFMRVRYDVSCTSRLYQWPYDTKTCTLGFGEQKLSKSYVTYKIYGRDNLVAFKSSYGTSWVLGNVSFKKNVNCKTQFAFTLTLERLAVGYVTAVIVPSVIASVLTVWTLFLNLDSKIRLNLACFSLLCHFIMLQNINFLVPKNSLCTPKVLLYISNSTAITCIVVFLIFTLNFLRKKVTGPSPVFVKLSNNIMESAIKHLVLHRYTTHGGLSISEDLNLEKVTEEWQILTNIINSLFIYLLIIVYIGLQIVYIPRSHY